jgi:hypothetical protein
MGSLPAPVPTTPTYSEPEYVNTPTPQKKYEPEPYYEEEYEDEYVSDPWLDFQRQQIEQQERNIQKMWDNVRRLQQQNQSGQGGGTGGSSSECWDDGYIGGCR